MTAGRRPVAGKAPAAACRLEAAGSGHVLRISGDCRIPRLTELDGALAALPRLPAAVTLDGEALAELDTAAALLLALRLRDAGLDPAAGAS